MADENNAGSPAWFDSIEGLSDETKGLIQTKGWQDAESMAQSYRELEKYVGANKADFIKIPKAEEGKSPDYSEVFKALGRPDSADGYDLSDTEFAKAAKEVLFEAGISQAQAKKLEEFVNKFSADALQKQESERVAAADARVAEEFDSLKKKWGSDYDKNIELAKMTAKEFGLTDEQLDALGDSVLGAGKLTELLVAAAKRSDGEHPLTGYKGTGGESKETARYKLEELKADPEAMKKLASGDEKIAAEITRLAAIATGN